MIETKQETHDKVLIVFDIDDTLIDSSQDKTIEFLAEGPKSFIKFLTDTEKQVGKGNLEVMLCTAKVGNNNQLDIDQLVFAVCDALNGFLKIETHDNRYKISYFSYDTKGCIPLANFYKAYAEPKYDQKHKSGYYANEYETKIRNHGKPYCDFLTYYSGAKPHVPVHICHKSDKIAVISRQMRNRSISKAIFLDDKAGYHVDLHRNNQYLAQNNIHCIQVDKNNVQKGLDEAKKLIIYDQHKDVGTPLSGSSFFDRGEEEKQSTVEMNKDYDQTTYGCRFI